MNAKIYSKVWLIILTLFVFGLLVPTISAVKSGYIVDVTVPSGCTAEIVVDVTAYKGKKTRGLDGFIVEIWDDLKIPASETFTVQPNGKSSTRTVYLSLTETPGTTWIPGVGIELFDMEGNLLDFIDPYFGLDGCDPADNLTLAKWPKGKGKPPKDRPKSGRFGN